MKKKSGIAKLWCEKYRPTVLNEVIFQNDSVEKYFKGIVAKRDMPNLLLSGVQGTGKTTISKVLINQLDIHDMDIMKIKCSDETGVDSMRDKISRFAETVPMGDFKIIQMEEADFLSQNAQAVLRHIVEDSSDSCRFIFTCNYSNKIMPALKSRLQEFQFTAPSQEEILLKMAEMLVAEDIEISDMETLEKVVASTYPDIRKTIQVLQQCSHSGKLVWQNSDTTNADYKFKLIDLIEAGDFQGARQVVCENVQREEYDDLFYFLYKNINRAPKFKSKDMRDKAIIVISDYEYKGSFMTHLDLNAEAMFISLINL